MTIGKKDDKNKPPVFEGVLEYFPLAILEIAKVSAMGAQKYDWGNWVHVQDGYKRYTSALCRHLVGKGDLDFDDESNLLHAAHVAWNSLARLELILKKMRKRKKRYVVDSGIEIIGEQKEALT
jgi:hypothetical protein